MNARRLLFALLLSALCGGVISCDRNSDNSTPAVITPPPSTPAPVAPGVSAVDNRPAAPLGHAVIRGHVLFVGPVPPPMKLDNAMCHRNHPKPIFDESVVVNPNGTLANVVVYLKDITGGAPAAAPVVMDQIDCQYAPHLVAICAGQTVSFHSSDATLHNVHLLCNVNRPANIAMTGANQSREVTFKLPEFVEVRCDVHPWMSGYVAVMDSPCFAVTGTDGSFEINNAPAGDHTLAAWHQQFHIADQSITASDTAPLNVEFKVQP